MARKAKRVPAIMHKLVDIGTGEHRHSTLLGTNEIESE
jgi:hypothetical protein